MAGGVGDAAAVSATGASIDDFNVGANRRDVHAINRASRCKAQGERLGQTGKPGRKLQSGVGTVA